jgi:hypothetical protein
VRWRLAGPDRPAYTPLRGRFPAHVRSPIYAFAESATSARAVAWLRRRVYRRAARCLVAGPDIRPEERMTRLTIPEEVDSATLAFLSPDGGRVLLAVLGIGRRHAAHGRSPWCRVDRSRCRSLTHRLAERRRVLTLDEGSRNPGNSVAVWHPRRRAHGRAPIGTHLEMRDAHPTRAREVVSVERAGQRNQIARVVGREST